MITIGIDPGIERVGVGIVEKKENSYNLIFMQLIKTSSKLPQAQRLQIISEELTEILEQFNIGSGAVEKLFFAKNTKTAMNVAEARGVILLTLQQNNIPIFEYTPLQIKQALTGYGRADKKQIEAIVRKIIGLEKVITSDDVADGIAIAITHINSHKIMGLVNKMGGKR